MSDKPEIFDDPTGVPGPDEASDTGPAGASERRTSAAAQAASRARRIGGRPRPRPGPHPDVADDVSDDVADAGAAVTMARTTDVPGAPVDTMRRGPEQSSEKPSTVRRWLPGTLRWAPAAAAALVVVVLAWANLRAYDGWQDKSGAASTSDRERILASAKSSVALVTSYDYRHIDADARAAEERLTGTFKSQYADSMSKVIKPGAAPQKAQVVGEVTSAGIASVGDDGKQAVILVFGQQTITNAASKQPQLDPVTIQVTMQRVRGKWLISNLARL